MAILRGAAKGLLRKSTCRTVKGGGSFTEPPARSPRWYCLPSNYAHLEGLEPYCMT